MTESVTAIEESMADEGRRLQGLMDAVTNMANHNVDTLKSLADTQSRVAALEADVAQLKQQAS